MQESNALKKLIFSSQYAIKFQFPVTGAGKYGLKSQG